MRRERIAPGVIQLPSDESRKEPVDPASYERISQVGSGSYGTVFKAHLQRSKNIYAIKTHKNINNYAGDQIRYRLMNELIMLSSDVILGKLDCPYVIKLRDWYQKNNQFGLIMDYHPTDLHKLLSQQPYGAMTEQDAKFFLAEMVLALEAVHEAGVIHNDLKPENILIDYDGNAILTDFGIAELGNDKKYGRYGTPVYMAPESLKICGHNKLADWWSFGVMMFELLTGCLPFEGNSSAELIKSQRKKIQYPSHLSDAARDLLTRLLYRNTNKRISNNVQNIKSHPFFSDIDWKKLANREVQSPLKQTDEPCPILTVPSMPSTIDKRKRREDSSMFSRMKLFFTAKKRYVQSAPSSPSRKCKIRTNRQRFSFRSLVPRFSTGHSTQSNPKSGCNV